MSNRINKKEFVKRLAKRMGQSEQQAEENLDAVLDELYDAFKRDEGVTFTNFGSFYLDQRRSGTVFKFNPSQRLRALFGWSSTYKGDL